ncbi:Rha family transcriptional regulator [Paenibacillus kobensis]|uniref:Rha family transcriptional regulator n=1 Tax=Paenibacillus kobensis TaxID=59841 RepID=UPI000FDA9A2C|nr:Rha family transcriptional regulator [Paenibacillus kobensis]
MNIVNVNGKFLVDSREVAEMIGKRHDHLVRDIDTYKSVIDQTPNLGADKFFIENSYSSGTGRKYKCYLLTKQGCDMVANKMTGEKGILFTATYVAKFAEMEQRQVNNVEILDERKQRVVMMKTMIDHEDRIDDVEVKIQSLEAKIDEQITLDSGEQRTVQKSIARRIYELESDSKARPNLFRQLHREVKDRWAVASYRDVRRNELDGLLSYINAWRPVAA